MVTNAAHLGSSPELALNDSQTYGKVRMEPLDQLYIIVTERTKGNARDADMAQYFTVIPGGRHQEK